MKRHTCSGKSDCFGCKVKSIQFAPSAMPSRRPGSRHAAWAKQKEVGLRKDLDAFKSMSDQGLRPRSTENAHDLMQRSTEDFEVEATGPIEDPKRRKRFKNAFGEQGRLDPRTAQPPELVRAE